MPCHHQYVSQRRALASVVCQGAVRGTKPRKWLERRGSMEAPNANTSAQKKTSRRTYPVDRRGSFWRRCLGTASWICLSVTVGGTYGRASLFHASCQRHRCSNGDGGGEGGGEGHWPDPSGTRRVAVGARRRPRRVRTGGRGACAERRCSPVVVLGAVLEHGVDGWGSKDADRIGEKGEKRCGVAAISEGQEACKGRRVDLASRPVVHPP